MTTAHPRGAEDASVLSKEASTTPPSDAQTTTQSSGSQTSPSFWKRHSKLLLGVLYVLVVACFFYYVLPRIIGLGPTLRLLRHGDFWWLALGVLFEVLSFAGESVEFHGVFATPENGLDMRGSAEIAVAGAAATKLFASAGAGGVALTVWALRGYGLSGTEIADGMVCYYILTYAVYMFAMVIAGYGLYLGLFSGPAPAGLTLAPAAFATVVILVVVAMLFVYEPTERFMQRRAERSSGRAAKRWRTAAKWPRALHDGELAAIGLVKRRDPALLGAIASWGFDIAVLWAGFRAFGHSPSGAVLVMGYYVGTMANVLPLPGGVGGVESGMIGTFLGFGVPRHLAVLAVLAYRTISYWLPAIPGAIAYVRLRRRFGGSPSTAEAEAEAHG